VHQGEVKLEAKALAGVRELIIDGLHGSRKIIAQMHTLLYGRNNHKFDVFLVWMVLKHVSSSHASSEHGRDKNSMEVNLIDMLRSILTLRDAQLVDGWIYQIFPNLELFPFFTIQPIFERQLLKFNVELGGTVSD